MFYILYPFVSYLLTLPYTKYVKLFPQNTGITCIRTLQPLQRSKVSNNSLGQIAFRLILASQGGGGWNLRQREQAARLWSKLRLHHSGGSSVADQPANRNHDIQFDNSMTSAYLLPCTWRFLRGAIEISLRNNRPSDKLDVSEHPPYTGISKWRHSLT
jgi:hypothetical protein